MKKIMLVIVVFLLVGCGKGKEEKILLIPAGEYYCEYSTNGFEMQMTMQFISDELLVYVDEFPIAVDFSVEEEVVTMINPINNNNLVGDILEDRLVFEEIETGIVFECLK